MNLTAFCNTSRMLIRNSSTYRLYAAAKPFHKIQVPPGVRCSAGKCDSCAKCIENDGENGDSGGDRRQGSHGAFGRTAAVASAAFSFNFFGKPQEKEEKPEDKLINTIKRSIICIQNSDYDKAEKMLHLALRMAQDLRSKEGITYVYDVMANLAMERGQYKKAEKIFAEVMIRLLASGHGEDSPQVLHISGKLAHMAQMQGELDKSQQGFQWTLNKLEAAMALAPNDKDLQELWGLIKNWYGQLLMKLGKYADAKSAFKQAHETLVEIRGKVNSEAVTILNNLSVACVNLEEFTEAKKYLKEALELVKELKDATQEGILQANMGLVYLREGAVADAREMCMLAWRTGKHSKNIDAVEQAEYCLSEIKTHMEAMTV